LAAPLHLYRNAGHFNMTLALKYSKDEIGDLTTGTINESGFVGVWI
jgi:hypothetical protein